MPCNILVTHVGFFICMKQESRPTSRTRNGLSMKPSVGGISKLPPTPFTKFKMSHARAFTIKRQIFGNGKSWTAIVASYEGILKASIGGGGQFRETVTTRSSVARHNGRSNAVSNTWLNTKGIPTAHGQKTDVHFAYVCCVGNLVANTLQESLNGLIATLSFDSDSL